MTNYTNGAASTVVTGTITSGASGNFDGVTDLSGYSSIRLGLVGPYNGTLTFQASGDGTNWQTIYLQNVNNSAGGAVNTAGTTGTNSLYAGPLHGRFFRLLNSAYTSGSAAITAVYSTAPYVAHNGSVAIPAGIFTSPAGTSLATFATTGAATTNLTQVATGQRFMYEVTISNPTVATVYWKAWDATSGSVTVGTTVPALTIPVAAGAAFNQSFGANGKRFGTALTWALTNSMAATDSTAVAAGVQVHGTYS